MFSRLRLSIKSMMFFSNPFAEKSFYALAKFTPFARIAGVFPFSSDENKNRSRRFRRCGAMAFLFVLTAAPTLPAQTTPIPAINGSAPLSFIKRADAGFALAAGDDALEAGLSAIAADLYADAIAAANTHEIRERAHLGLAGAQLDRNDPGGALKTLAFVKNSPAKSVRLALAHAALGNPPRAETALNSISAIEFGGLSTHDRSWYCIAQGLVALAERKFESAKSLFAQAEAGYDHKTESPQRRQIRMLYALAWIRERGLLPDDEFATLRENTKKYKDSQIGFELAKELAIELNRRGDKSGASELLRNLIFSPARPLSQNEISETLFLRGIILGADNKEGRVCLYDVIRKKSDPDLQMQSLQALGAAVAQTAPDATAAVAREIFEELSEIAAGSPDTRTLDLLNLTRAKVIFPLNTADARAKAERAANAVLEKTPNSPYQPDALRILASVAWKNKSYRRTADYLLKLKNIVLPAKQPHLGLLAADALFLAAQSSPAELPAAAAAYAAVQPLIIDPDEFGAVLFNRVDCELKNNNIAGALQAVAEARETVAGYEKKPAPEIFFRCEWAIIDKLRREGNINEAAERLTRLLAENPRIGDSFRFRFLWQQAQLAFAAGNYKRAGEIAETVAKELRQLPPNAPDELAKNKEKIISQADFLRARSNFALGESERAENELRALRKNFAEEEAAAESYIFEGSAFSAKGDHAAAAEAFEKAYRKYRQTDLPSDRQNPSLNKVAALALFLAARETVIVGQNGAGLVAYTRAQDLYEQFAAEFKNNELVTRANLAQADLYRLSDDFDHAALLYGDIAKNSPGTRDGRCAELRRADCILAKAVKSNTAGNVAAANTQIKNAAEAYQLLFERPDQWPDMTAEAGYKWANAISLLKPDPNEVARGEAAIRNEAVKSHWFVVRQLTAGEKTFAALGTGRFWLARSLFDIAQLYEQQGKFEDAREAFRYLLDCNRKVEGTPEHALPGENLARKKLEELPRGTKNTAGNNAPNNL